MTPRPRPRSAVDKGMAASKAHGGEDDDIAEVGVQTPLEVRNSSTPACMYTCTGLFHKLMSTKVCTHPDG